MTPSLEKLTSRLASLPGIGKKSAGRLAYYLISLDESEVHALTDAILNAKKAVKRCKTCQCYSESDVCSVCSSPKRDRSTICIVEDTKSMQAIEELGEYNGLYHVLNGVIAPLEGVMPEQLTIKELLARLNDGIKEVIVATNPSAEGDATGMYLSRLIRPLGINVTRLAYGLPVGASLEYADSFTLLRALEGRTEL